ncbi:MAG: hypothetical protein FK733_07690 [Asgard group archaeon]|nr:hypothetical protein [Asgard group archaeon]
MQQELSNKYRPVAIYILYHQMFSEPNFIRDRRTVFKIPVEGSGKIIQKMLEIMLAQIKLWENGKEKEFIEFLSKELKLDPANMLEKYSKRLEFLNEQQSEDKPAKLMLVYCDMLTDLMVKIKDDVLEQLYEIIKVNLSEDEFEEIITNLPDNEDAMFNIILNLAALKNFAKITKEPQPEKEYFTFVNNLVKFLKQESAAS